MSASPSIGGSVTVRYTKWDGSRHWTFPATYLGEDEYGHRVGQARGAVVERPGARFESPWHVVVLFPRDGFTAGFYKSPKAIGYVGIGDQISAYIDITTAPTWMHVAEGSAVSMADLDLDVVKQLDGNIFVDDRDEFAEHQVALAGGDRVGRVPDRSHAHRASVDVRSRRRNRGHGSPARLGSAATTMRFARCAVDCCDQRPRRTVRRLCGDLTQ